ncbi:30S ribosomal protein S9, mitochondrial [Tanacetum coccineum]|uniref:30S ribosomal protein S9, mitochondrial n=1 Tax=Tanacetum coccineum TaxID=301880 RepID=A0ABQ5D9T4_9ASTR
MAAFLTNIVSLMFLYGWLGRDHAFDDLIAASGITDDMLDSLMALKDLDDVPELPPLSAIEDMRYEKNTRKSRRADIELQKQEEIANARKFIINDNQFVVYFPVLDQRAALLRPVTVAKTLGLLDAYCTVKGVVIRLNVSFLTVPVDQSTVIFLFSSFVAGFLTKDSRIVERKKPCKAKARKSFQWVKR